MRVTQPFRRFLPPLLLLWFVLPATAGGQVGSNDTLPPLAIRIDEQKVTVTDGHPNGKILIVGYERAGGRFKLTYRRHRAYLAADAAGEVSLTTRRGIAPDSTWVAVDVQSGRYGAVTPGTSPVRERSLPRSALKNATNGQLKELVAGLPMAYLIVVRPGEGVWELSAGDGGRHDRDNVMDGKTEMSVDDFLTTTIAFADDPLVAGVTELKGAHVGQLRQAIDAVRTQAGLAPTWGNSNAATGVIYGGHIIEMRSRLNEARMSLGLAAVPFVEPNLTPYGLMSVTYLNELRNGVK